MVRRRKTLAMVVRGVLGDPGTTLGTIADCSICHFEVLGAGGVRWHASHK